MTEKEKSLSLRDEVRAQNYRNTERAVAIGRAVVIFFLLLYVNTANPPGWRIPLLNILLFIAAAYTVFLLVVTAKMPSFSIKLTLFSMYCDALAIGTGLYYTGGIESPFFFLWYLTLFTAGARFGYLKSFAMQIPIASICIFLVYTGNAAQGAFVLDRLIPGLFSITAVSLFGAIFSWEEQHTLTILESFHKESTVDRLTGLYNYAYFMDELKKEMARSARKGPAFSLALFDLDFFKSVNDTWGHEKGNILLKQVANILKSNARAMDTVARYGGEEFVILMPNSSGAEMEVAERMRKKIEETEFHGIAEKPIKITISGGISCFPRDASTISELLDHADIGLYRSKSSGKNRICCSNQSLSPKKPASVENSVSG